MKGALLVFLMVFITSCDLPYEEDYPYKPDKRSLANEVRNKTMAQLKRDYDLYPFGIGSQMMYQIKMLALSFRYYKEVDIKEARELLMTSGNIFLKTINSNEKIRQFLDNYPFKPENIQISIFLQKLDGTDFGPNKLFVVTMVNGVLEYGIQHPHKYKLITVYKETFEEAALKLSMGVGAQSAQTL